MTPDELQAIGLSLAVASLATALSAPLAIVTGFVLARMQRGRTWLEAVVMAPLVLPPVATGYLLLIVLGPTSVPFTFAAAVVAAAVMAFPLFVRAVRQAIEAVDPGLEQAARTLGASPTATFFRVTLPLARPGVISGAVLAFARALGEFGATIILAGNISGTTRTLPLALFSALQVPGGDASALRLVAVAMVLSVGALAASEWLLRRGR